MIHKTMVASAKAVDEAEGIVEAYTNTMGVVDADGDIVESTAFNASIADNLPIPVLSGHDQGKLVGKVIFAQPRHIEGDEYRLFTRMQMNMETEAGRDAFSNVAGNYVREWSIGFNIPQESDVEQEGSDVSTVVRRIANLDWVEVSSVVRGSSPSTSTVAAKASPIIELRSAEPPDHSKPFPNFHACRIREPEEFDRFRTADETIDDKPVVVLYGREVETEDWDIASYHLPVDEWTEDEARAFCEEHDGIKFEPATGEDEDAPGDDDEPGDDDATDDAASDTAPRAALDTAERTLRLQRVKLALHGIHNQNKEN
jgi:HK97 family phage prohead protease